MPEEVKALTITGGAADDYRKLRGVTRRRGRRAAPPTFSQEGGDHPPGASLASPTNYNAARRLSANMKIFKGGAAETIGQGSPLKGGAEPLPGSNPPNPINLSAMPAVAVNSSARSALSTPPLKGGANLKAGLMPPTQEHRPTPLAQAQTAPTAPSTPSAPRPQTGGVSKGGKITLAPPKKKRTTAVLLAPPAKKQHRKGVHQTRKIRMQLAGLKTRLTRAKIIHKDSREKSIADVRKLLEEAKLVKPAKEGKQVPESVLRDIYKDYLLLRNKAL